MEFTASRGFGEQIGQQTEKEAELNGLQVHKEILKGMRRDVLSSITNAVIVDAGGERGICMK